MVFDGELQIEQNVVNVVAPRVTNYSSDKLQRRTGHTDNHFARFPLEQYTDAT